MPCFFARGLGCRLWVLLLLVALSGPAACKKTSPSSQNDTTFPIETDQATRSGARSGAQPSSRAGARTGAQPNSKAGTQTGVHPSSRAGARSGSGPVVDKCGNYRVGIKLPARFPCRSDSDCAITDKRPGTCNPAVCTRHYWAGTKAWVAAAEKLHARVCAGHRVHWCVRYKCTNKRPQGAVCKAGKCAPKRAPKHARKAAQNRAILGGQNGVRR
jgi:hypothetical protein